MTLISWSFYEKKLSSIRDAMTEYLNEYGRIKNDSTLTVDGKIKARKSARNTIEEMIKTTQTKVEDRLESDLERAWDKISESDQSEEELIKRNYGLNRVKPLVERAESGFHLLRIFSRSIQELPSYAVDEFYLLGLDRLKHEFKTELRLVKSLKEHYFEQIDEERAELAGKREQLDRIKSVIDKEFRKLRGIVGRCEEDAPRDHLNERLGQVGMALESLRENPLKN